MSGSDSLSGESGSDRLTGGTGADAFVFNSLVGADTITDYTLFEDKLRISKFGFGIGDGDLLVEGATVISAPGLFAATAETVIVTNDLAGLSAADAAAALGSATSGYAVNQQALFVVDNGTDSALFLFRSSSTDAVVSAAERTLLGTLTDVTGLTSDFVFIV
jgi:Ca2+-binding RTX toxin-like protein